MATVFSKSIQPVNGNWLVTFAIASKDPDDVLLAQEFGDLTLNYAGRKLVDPEDETFSFMIPRPSYILDGKGVWSDILLNTLPNIKFEYLFDDATVNSSTRYRQATIFTDQVQADLTAALVALRAMPTNTPINTTFSV